MSIRTEICRALAVAAIAMLACGVATLAHAAPVTVTKTSEVATARS